MLYFPASLLTYELKVSLPLTLIGSRMPSEIFETLKSFPEAKLEIEVNALVHNILESRERLTEILSRYGVAKPEDIKAKIAKGELKAHPAFEDYLSALTYQIDMNDILKKLEEKLNELKRFP